MEEIKNTPEAESQSVNEVDDGTVTMVDVLEQESEQEADANAVLGGADDKNCTYAEGHLSRQPLYACKTCCKDKPAGVCLACSYKCHEGHDLIELYTKRNFRCDCGNAAFGKNKCVLDPIKDAESSGNEYNQNFRGLYCVCARPYPDPEDDVEDEMIQCVVCEDWFHGRHLESKMSPPQDYEEMVCHICMEKLSFLRQYAVAESASTATSQDSGPVDVVTVNGESKEEGAAVNCKMTAAGDALKEAAYFPSGWRGALCKCSTCIQMYENKKVTFLMDDSDTVRSYEKNNSSVRETQYEAGMRALSGLDRVRQLEAIQSYNEMKSALMEHLAKFKETKRVVSETDIHEFFAEMKAKRPRIEIPSTCR